MEVDAPVHDVTRDECDSCQPVVCPNCQQLHSVNPTNGEVLAADELGDPW